MEINIQRINELARKAKAEGLTPAEKEEQQKLRREYIAAVKMNLRTQLDNIDMQEKDGTIESGGALWKQKETLEKKFLPEEEQPHRKKFRKRAV